MNETLQNWQPKILSVLRFVAGFLFFWHGTQKLFGYPPSDRGGGGGGLSALIATAGTLELVGGALLIIGLFTRWTSFILCGLMAVAYWMAHGTQAFLPIQNGGELAVLYCFVFLYLFFAGGGVWSLDSLILNKKKVE